MSLVHLVMTKVTGYDLFTLHFDNRNIDEIGFQDPFSFFENEFVDSSSLFQFHPEHTLQLSYCGYFIFPEIDSGRIYKLYRSRCESGPSLKARYNLSFNQEYAHLEDRIKRIDSPVDSYIESNHKHRTYSHSLEYFGRSIQILRDMQMAIYETETSIAVQEMDLHRIYLESLAKTGNSGKAPRSPEEKNPFESNRKPR